MIQAENISLRAGEFYLNHVSLQVQKGEYFVLLGPPGSGKTLFLEALCGLRRLESGTIYIDGRDVSGMEPRFRMIGYVPQDYALFPHRSVRKNISFGLEAAGLSNAEIERRVDEIVDWLNLGYLLHRSIEGLSGGERQKVALGRALVIRPRVLLLDEPVSALDESTRESVCRQLKHIQGELGLATIHVCHHLQEAFSVADRTGILKKGEFQQVGTLEDLTMRPINTFVANFMRCRNILSGKVLGPSDREGWTVVETGEQRFSIPGTYTGTLDLIIRPDRIRIERNRDSIHDPVLRIPGVIRRIADQGAYLQVELDASFPLILHAIREELAGMNLLPGTETTALVRPENIHVLVNAE